LRYDFSGQLAFGELRRIMRVGRPMLLKLLPILIVLVLVGNVLTSDQTILLQDPASYIPALAVAATLIALLFLGPEWATRKSWKTNSSLREPFRGAVTTDGIEWFGTHSQASYSWERLHGYRLRNNLCLVYSSSNQVIWIIPRFFSSQTDWEEAVSLIRQNLKRR
jgi:hypothetical protein